MYVMQADLPFSAPIRTRFDSDSIKCYLDNACSWTMSDIERIIPLVSSHGLVVGNGKLKFEAIGTFIFDVEDEHGHVNTVQIPNSVYVPGLDHTLILCPQHWSKEDG